MEIQTLLQRSWLWFPGCLLAEEVSYQKHYPVKPAKLWCWEAASAAGLCALAGAGRSLQDGYSEPEPPCPAIGAAAGETQEQNPSLRLSPVSLSSALSRHGAVVKEKMLKDPDPLS